IEPVEIDADGKMPGFDHAVLPFDQGVMTLPAENFGAGQEGENTVGEITAVAKGLETDQIVLEQGTQQLDLPGETPEKVRGGKGDVEKVGQGLMDPHLPRVGSGHGELVVLNPDQIVLCGDLEDR